MGGQRLWGWEAGFQTEPVWIFARWTDPQRPDVFLCKLRRVTATERFYQRGLRPRRECSQGAGSEPERRRPATGENCRLDCGSSEDVAHSEHPREYWARSGFAQFFRKSE